MKSWLLKVGLVILFFMDNFVNLSFRSINSSKMNYSTQNILAILIVYLFLILKKYAIDMLILQINKNNDVIFYCTFIKWFNDKTV